MAQPASRSAGDISVPAPRCWAVLAAPSTSPRLRGSRLLVPAKWHSPESVTAPPSEAISCDTALHDYYFHGLLNAPKNKV